MTKEEIIELSRQAGLFKVSLKIDDKHETLFDMCLLDFAKLIKAEYGKLHASLWLKRIDDAVKKEREECANTAENISSYDRDEPEVSIAKAIRARKQDA